MTDHAPIQALIPSNMADAMRLAEIMATGRLVPQALQKSPADCLMVIMQAIRWEMDVFAVAQETAVISGKLMYQGKLVAAVINARGNLTNRLRFEFTGGGEDLTVTVVGQLRGEAEPRTVTVRLADARTSNVQWQKQPDQQLCYHGARKWARRHTPELMLGVYSPEEFDDEPRSNGSRRAPPPVAANPMVAPQVTAATLPQIAAPQAAAPAPAHDPETGEVTDAPPPDTADLTDHLRYWDYKLADAAERGMKSLEAMWHEVPAPLQHHLKAALDRRFKPRAMEIDAAEAREAAGAM